MGRRSSLPQVTRLNAAGRRRRILHLAACVGVLLCAGLGAAGQMANGNVDRHADVPEFSVGSAADAPAAGVPAGDEPAPPSSPADAAVASSGSASGGVAPDSPPAQEPAPAPHLATREYTVEPGDSVRGIAQRFAVSNETIIWENDLTDPDNLAVGQTLELLPFTGLVHEVRPGDTLASVVNTYGARLDEVIAVNRLHDPFIIVVGQKLAVPGGYRPLPRKAIVAPAPADAAAGAAPAPADTVETPLPPSDQALAAAAPAKALPVLGDTPQERYIGSVARAAVASADETGVPASVTIAQAILESYWGSSRLSTEANNYFGIKAQSRPGTAGVVWFDVWEVVGGRSVVQHQPFRAYHTLAESFADHGHFFLENGRYAAALAVRRDARQFARAIASAGYATDPAYASKLIGLMDRYDLYRYD